MSSLPYQSFDCQIFVPRRGGLNFALPAEPGPTKVARLEFLDYNQLSDPSFRRLLVAFQKLQTA